jgi:hypothetical protein
VLFRRALAGAGEIPAPVAAPAGKRGAPAAVTQ